MLRTEFIVINFLLFLTLALAGVYPNFHHDFEFINTNNSNIDENNVKIVKNNNWWKTANFYQIYPRSFKDSDGDGIGDLKGITSKLSYLKEIGITATWLSPIFKSPMVDFGYDISDFKEIDELFGTMKDFEELIVEAKQLGIKIILDFVPNHSSDKHEWFIKSAEGDETYADFYVWHPGKPNPNNPQGRNLPPSNWLSVFRGSAWTWVEKRKAFYLHQFASGQPDLNYKNPKVQEAMKDVLRFWLEKGVDGFRIDAVPHVFECANKEDGSFVDEPISGWSDDPEDYGYLKHICTVDQPETLDLVYDWRKVMDEFQDQSDSETKVLLTEQWSPIEIAMKYYGTKEIPGAHVPFNFFIIQDIWRNDNAKRYAEVINKWLSQMDDFRIPNWVLGNHDKNRVGSRLGTDRIDMMNMMIMTLPGVAITYQGEEIGMTDVSISWEDTKDPQACNSDRTKYASLSRDPERTPFQWNDEKNSGFSDADKTWLPMALNYTKANVKHERGTARSKLSVYKALRDLRDEDAFRLSFKAKVVALNDNVLAILRSYKNDHYITLMNVNDEIESVNIQKEFPEVPKELEYVVVTDRSPHAFGDEAYADEVILLQKEAVVLRSKNKQKSLNFYQYKLN